MYSDCTSSLIQTINTPYAVLDLHFSPSEPKLLAVATSTGCICLYTTESFGPDPIGHVKTIDLVDSSTLVLALAWCPTSMDRSTIAASFSDGRIATIDYEAPESSFKAATSHSLEAWTLAWSAMADQARLKRLYSGGDDSVICHHEHIDNQLAVAKDTEDAEREEYRPILRNSKIHTAGVTAILPLSTFSDDRPEILLTGSYDEFVRVLQPRSSSTRNVFQCLAEKRLHGGVWRLKLMRDHGSQEDRSFIVLASCMHAGARVLKIKRREGEDWKIDIVARFEEHSSMNYASDSRLDSDEGDIHNFTVISTSFYDRKLCVWRFQDIRK